VTRRAGIALAPAALATLLLARGAAAQGSGPVVSAGRSPADSVPLTTLASLESRIEELDQRLRILARLRELQEDSLRALERTRPRITGGSDGLAFQSASGDFQLRVRGYVQSDGRFVLGGAAAGVAPTAAGTFLLRRVRPIVEASLSRHFGVRVMPDFGMGRTILYDAYVDGRVGEGASSPLVVRAGKFKPPLGLERLQSASDLRFAERGLPTNLVPNRDVGLQVGGDLLGGALSYAAGVFDGAADLGNLDGDGGRDKDVDARLFAQPFRRRGPRALQGLGLGLAASRGREHGTAAASGLPSYVTPGQQPLFRYASGTADSSTTVADGRRTRLVPQGWLYVGPLGLLGEAVTSAQDVRRGARTARLTHHAWQLAGSWFLTGEAAGFGGVVPRHPLGAGPHAWGAVELTARYGALALDPATFPTFASPLGTPERARAWAAGVNWHLVRGVKAVADYEVTRFAAGEHGGARAPERLVVTRLQTTF
jgi:phosphate-selective porin OprO/OprP